MKRFLAPLALLLVAGTVAQAQTVTRTYSTSDGFGNSTTTTAEIPANLAGIVDAQTIYGGFPSYAGGVPGYIGGYAGGYSNYNTYPAYGGYNYGYGYPAPYGYNAVPGYFVPGQTVPLGIPDRNGAPPPTVTVLPQFVPNVPYGYDCPPYGYGYSSRTTVAGASLSYNRGGLGVNIRGGSTTGTSSRSTVGRRPTSRRLR